MSRWLIVLLLVCSAGVVSAQTRAAGPMPFDDSPPRVDIDVSAGGNLSRGLVDRDLVTARGVLDAASGPWLVFTQPYFLFARVRTPMAKVTSDDELYDRTGIFRSLGDPFFVYAVNAYDRSLRRRIDHRELFGGGAGVTLWRCRTNALVTSVGALYELADYDDNGNESPLLASGEVARGVREVGRWSARVYGHYSLLGGRVGITHDIIVIPSFRHPTDDYRLLLFASVEAPLANGFLVRVQVDATREGRAIIVEGTEQDDVNITFALAYKSAWSRGGK